MIEIKNEPPDLKDLERVLENESGALERWTWKIKGMEIWHHPTEPAVQYKNGYWVWFWMNKRHCLSGPASYFKKKFTYFIDGEELTKKEWERHPKRLEWLGRAEK